jgi:hypothetical protein
MLTFGIVGKVIKLWTDASAPYDQFIPDTDLDSYRYMSMDSGIVSNFVPTPHFKVSIDIGGNFPADLSISNISRVRASVINYKPINTVFDGITAYLKTTAKVGVWMSPIDAKGRIQADVGYNIEFGDIYRNCSI